MSGALLSHALAYLKAGWALFPLHNPTASGCSCGQACSSPGKHPRSKSGDVRGFFIVHRFTL